MGNPNLLPYETIVRATSGEPEAVDEVLRHYSKRIRIAAIENGHTEDNIKQRLVAAPQEQNSMMTVINTAVSFNICDFIDIAMPPIILII